jgi:hypothetical protein
MGKATTVGVCPYCKTALNTGATACTGCSAFETTGWRELGMWRVSLLGACFFIGPFVALLIAFLSPVAGMVALVAFPVGYFLIRFRLKRKIVWTVGGRRLI